MTDHTISDDILRQIIEEARRSGSEALALRLLDDPRIVRDLARQHAAIGQIVLRRRMGIVCACFGSSQTMQRPPKA